MSARHRDTILARRALFLSTALSTLGCPSSQPASSDDVETAEADKPERRKRKGKAKPQIPSNTPWSEVMAKAPPHEVPVGLSPREARQLEAVNANAKLKYEAIRAVWGQTPGCDPDALPCKDWRAVMQAAQKMYRAAEPPFMGSCGGAAGRTGTVVKRQQAHGAYVGALISRVEAHLQQVALHYGPSGVKAWAGLLTKAKEPPPRPCLSPCAMPQVEDVVETVGFADNDATLRDSDPAVRSALMSVLSAQQRQAARASLVIRGHADAGEKDPKQLGKQRAEAVLKWLEKNGLSSMSTVSLGATLVIESSTGPSGGAANRRVDFEVIPH